MNEDFSNTVLKEFENFQGQKHDDFKKYFGDLCNYQVEYATQVIIIDRALRFGTSCYQKPKRLNKSS